MSDSPPNERSNGLLRLYRRWQKLFMASGGSSKPAVMAKTLYKFKPYNWELEEPRSPSRSRSRNLASAGKNHRHPKPRSGHRIVYHDGHVYSFGGFNPSLDGDLSMENDAEWEINQPLFKELWQFNVTTRVWRRLPIIGNAPDQLASHTATTVTSLEANLSAGRHPRTTMLVYGGTGAPFGHMASNKVSTCDFKTFQWNQLDVNNESEDQLPKPLYGQAIAVDPVDEMFYTVGGTSGFSYFMDVHRLNLRSKTWEMIYKGREDFNFFDHNDLSEPSPRYRHELCYYKQMLIVLGGGTSLESDHFENIFIFDIVKRTWNCVKTHGDPTIPIDTSIRDQYPPPRRCHSIVQDGQFVFVIGGYDGDQIFPGFWRLDLESMDWRRMPYDLPEPVYFHASAITDAGKVLTFGGVNDVKYNTRSSAVHSCWIKVASLREMCWEALNHYFPNLDDRPVETLLEEGIPSDLIDRLQAEPDDVG